jgi:hypothetical protein
MLPHGNTVQEQEIAMRALPIHVKYLMTISTCIVFGGCYVPARYYMRRNLYLATRTVPTYAIDEQQMITVWIHGTRLFQRPLSRKHFFSTTPGLFLAMEISPGYYLRTIAQTLCASDPVRFNLATFYHFCWSGKLCFNERLCAAHDLHNALNVLMQAHTHDGKRPKLRVIAHSHGGNVCLNLALIKRAEPLFIDELILLACPVQDQTKELVKDPMFGRIYALYSAIDLIQILDPQGFYKHKAHADTLFSKRQFAHQPNLAQMKIKVDRRAIMHTEFSHSAFLRLLPSILDEIDAWQEEIQFNQDPNKISRMLCVYTHEKARKRLKSRPF